ncbi:MAG: ABC transporter permease [Gammaproteobacteria bacterium]|nr:ABC transporter permease [Gammaproteobacteria bacterium]MCP4091710.1 ABC transporter permease [Gammaproteobacteria bacterium]MCP4275017.1 ABC transporter permease [Gammaproteobacteria bacterium]MCP4831840.1 ABC transporter permease [Gammaproteobacteria bacterium]MCP4929776.1 ABC transporter permease [Gammaproteobacteria bacterium]
MARNKANLNSQFQRWRKLHIRNCVDALLEFRSQPIATALTVAVIGIALALPASLNLLVQNGRSLAGTWESARDFSVYIKPGEQLTVANTLAEELRNLSSIDTVIIITADEAMNDFKEASGLGEVLETLGTNPLPHTLVVRPNEAATVLELAALGEELSTRPIVDMVKIDTEWVARLNAILDFLNRIVLMGSLLLIIAVVIIVGNTIRLDIQNRRDEIEVLKLLGASDGFVRRPFLYIGLWYGLIGGGIAFLLLQVGGWLLAAPLERLIGLYATEINLLGMDRATTLFVIGGGILSGWGGAWSAVSRHLAIIQPK